jgi:hypothetical protein
MSAAHMPSKLGKRPLHGNSSLDYENIAGAYQLIFGLIDLRRMKGVEYLQKGGKLAFAGFPPKLRIATRRGHFVPDICNIQITETSRPQTCCEILEF